MRILSMSAILLPLLFSGTRTLPQTSPERNTPDLIKSSADAVVLIVTSDATGMEMGQGSGFIVSSDGKVITNYHVIKGARTAIAKLANGAFFPIEGVYAFDADKDLAILKVPGKNLPTLSLSDSGKLQIGEHVVAIGSPLGLQNTVSDGIISGIRDDTAEKMWIQTTAPVSPGNSGGPLLKMDGTVAGVITWGVKIGQNLNFAAPSNEAANLLQHTTKLTPLASQITEASVSKLSLPSGRIWTSMTTGRDYKIRFDGDFAYTEWINLPAELSGTAAFSRAELKRVGNSWPGKNRAYLPCHYKDPWQGWQVTWFTTEVQFEITSVTDSRIEGRAEQFPAGFDCRKRKPKGSAEWQSFTWIPKD